MNPYIAECLSTDWTELSQEGNLNANSRLFRKGGRVRKLYTGPAEANIRVLRDLMAREDLGPVPELMLPDRLLRRDGEVLGFEMDWAEGETLRSMNDRGASLEQRLRAVERCADALRRFPPDLTWGDAHADNIIVSGDRVRIADPDGLGLSCPMEPLTDSLPEGYKRDGKLVISRNTDWLCLCGLALAMLTDGFEFYLLPESWQLKYVSFLEENGASLFADAVRSTLRGTECRAEPGAFSFNGERAGYRRFLLESGLLEEERASGEWLDRLIEERKEDG